MGARVFCDGVEGSGPFPTGPISQPSVVDSYEVRWSVQNARLEALGPDGWFPVDKAAAEHVEALGSALRAYQQAFQHMVKETPREPGTPSSDSIISFHHGFTTAVKTFRSFLTKNGIDPERHL